MNFSKQKKPCKFAVMGCDGWECDAYDRIECEHQHVDYNYYGGSHKEINVVDCLMISNPESEVEKYHEFPCSECSNGTINYYEAAKKGE